MEHGDQKESYLNLEGSEALKQASLIIFEGLRNLLVNMDIYLIRIQPKLRDNNWFFTPSMDANLWNFIRDNIDQKNDIESFLNDAFVNYFSSENFSNLDFMVQAWRHSPLLSDRLHILKECVFVLKDSSSKNSNIENPHYIVIPTLIAQIDGSMTNYLLKNGYDYEGQKLKNASNGQTDKKENLFREEVTKFLYEKYSKDLSVSTFLLEEGTTAIHLLLDILFQRAFPEQKMDDLIFPFSRNKIMHGQFLGYGNAEDTIRLFLLLDFIASLKDT